jgi:two-component system phosphate regulon sensor histidine kinase PhoR
LVLNLLENAVKYGAERGGEVGVRVAPADGHVVLQVSDQGSGIHPDDLKRIFERFYRARDARSNKVRGSGIGLALVKEIAEAHGGRVSVESVLGKGSTFTVTLPVAASEASGSRAVQDKQGAHGAHQEREP